MVLGLDPATLSDPLPLGLMLLTALFIALASLVSLAMALFMVPFFFFHYGLFCFVHGVFLRLFAGGTLPLESRQHFFAAAAQAMRWIIVDHARRRLADRRGGGLVRVELDEDQVDELPPQRVIELDQALEEGPFLRVWGSGAAAPRRPRGCARSCRSGTAAPPAAAITAWCWARCPS